MVSSEHGSCTESSTLLPLGTVLSKRSAGQPLLSNCSVHVHPHKEGAHPDGCNAAIPVSNLGTNLLKGFMSPCAALVVFDI